MAAAALVAAVAGWWLFGSQEPAPSAAPQAEVVAEALPRVAPPEPTPAPAVAAPTPAQAAGAGEASGSAAVAPALEPVPEPGPTPAPTPIPTPKADKRPPPRVHLAEPRGQATIRIIYPGTSGSYKVVIDGKAVGESPKALFPVSAGSHTVQVKFYGKKFEKTVRLAPGTSTSIRPTF